MPDLGPYFFDPNPGPPDIYTYVLTAIYAALFVVSLFFAIRSGALFQVAPPIVRPMRIAGIVGAIVAAGGLLLATARFFEFPPFAARIWLLIPLAVAVILLGFFIYYLRVLLPPRLLRYRQQQIRQQYISRSHRRPTRKKGKQGKKK
ncbi:MAG: hypothetical protein ACYC1C_12605 [Chloroflexota bacterium]